MQVRVAMEVGEVRRPALPRSQRMSLVWLIAGLAILLAFAVPRSALALGIGSISLVSGPGEPLEARIALFPSSPDWSDGLEAGLASEAVFERVGLEREPELAALRFAIRVTRDGDPFIAVTTDEPLAVDFLSFILEVRWFGGRVLREYTLLLEPPLLFAEDDQQPVISSAEQADDAGRGVIERSPQAAEDLPETPMDVEAPAVVATEQPPAAADPGPVADATAPPRSREVIRNDTLWSIALETRPDDDISVYQMMIALFRANPDAFINDNLNLVRAGAVLRIPDRSEITDLPVDDARTLFSGQVAEWERMRAQALPPDDEAVALGSAPATGGDLLRVVAAGELVGDTSGVDETAASALDATRQLQNEVSSLQEREASLTAERDELATMNRELMARVDALERVVNLDADPGLRDGGAAASAQVDPTSSSVPFWLDRRTHAALVLVLLFLLLLWVLRLRRERDEARLMAFGARRDVPDEVDGLPRGAEPASRQVNAFLPASIGGEQPPRAGVEQFLATFDPAGEAEYFVQRGETARAEDLFDLALAADKTDLTVWMRWLEVLAEADKGDRYLEIADRFQQLFGTDHPRWEAVQRMGLSLRPEHPRFAAAAVSGSVADTPAATPAKAQPARSDATPARSTAAPPTAVSPTSAAASADDWSGTAPSWSDAFSLDSPSKADPAPAPTPESSPAPTSPPAPAAREGRSTAVSDGNPVIGEAVKSERRAAGKSAVSGSILTWSAGGAETGSPRSVRSRSLRERPSQTLDGTLSAVQPGRRAGAPPVTTPSTQAPSTPRRSRLERARVYFERGDKEMGRHLLSEVLDSGSPDDREAALSLLERYA